MTTEVVSAATPFAISLQSLGYHSRTREGESKEDLRACKEQAIDSVSMAAVSV